MQSHHNHNVFKSNYKKSIKMDKEIRARVRILSTDIIGEKKILNGLTSIHGISTQFSNAVCEVLNLEKTSLIGHLNDQQVKEIEEVVKNPKSKNIPSWMFNRRFDYDTGEDMHLNGPALKLRTEFDIRHMKKIKSYKGMRHAWGLPVRGQCTKGHFRHGKAVGVVKKKEQQQAKKPKKE